ncbi:MAG: hypothetical protein SNJ77_01135 [Cytophagales bacterium]
MNKSKYTSIIFLITVVNCFAQYEFEPQPPLFKKLLSKNRNENWHVLFLNSRFGAKTIKNEHQLVRYQFIDNDDELVTREVNAPNSNLLNHMDFSICHYVSKSNFVLDFFNFGFSFRGKRRTPGSFRSSFIASGVGYQFKLNKSCWLRTMGYIGYSKITHHLGERLYVYEDEEDENELFSISVQQTKMLLRPEISLVKHIGKDAGISISLNVSYDGGAFVSDRVRDAGVDDIGIFSSFQNYNMTNEHGKPLRKMIVNPNQFNFSIGVAIFVNDFIFDDYD